MLTPFTLLVGECGQTKVTKVNGTKKVTWHWDEVHQRAFDHIKATIVKGKILKQSPLVPSSPQNVPLQIEFKKILIA